MDRRYSSPTWVFVVIALLVLSACGSGGDDVPDDQAVKPASTPAGWTRTDLEAVTVAAPPAWV